MKELINEAKRAMNNAYAPYSNFHVGAAILLKDGKIIIGSNVENASYGLTVCAERNCIFQVYSQGYRKEDIVAMALVSTFSGNGTPCGACRQVLSELYPAKKPIYIVKIIDGVEEVSEVHIEDLLPYAFTEEDLK